MVGWLVRVIGQRVARVVEERESMARLTRRRNRAKDLLTGGEKERERTGEESE